MVIFPNKMFLSNAKSNDFWLRCYDQSYEIKQMADSNNLKGRKEIQKDRRKEENLDS